MVSLCFDKKSQSDPFHAGQLAIGSRDKHKLVGLSLNGSQYDIDKHISEQNLSTSNQTQNVTKSYNLSVIRFKASSGTGLLKSLNGRCYGKVVLLTLLQILSICNVNGSYVTHNLNQHNSESDSDSDSLKLQNQNNNDPNTQTLLDKLIQFPTSFLSLGLTLQSARENSPSPGNESRSSQTSVSGIAEQVGNLSLQSQTQSLTDNNYSPRQKKLKASDVNESQTQETNSNLINTTFTMMTDGVTVEAQTGAGTSTIPDTNATSGVPAQTGVTTTSNTVTSTTSSAAAVNTNSLDPIPNTDSKTQEITIMSDSISDSSVSTVGIASDSVSARLTRVFAYLNSKLKEIQNELYTSRVIVDRYMLNRAEFAEKTWLEVQLLTKDFFLRGREIFGDSLISSSSTVSDSKSDQTNANSNLKSSSNNDSTESEYSENQMWKQWIQKSESDLATDSESNKKLIDSNTSPGPFPLEGIDVEIQANFKRKTTNSNSNTVASTSATDSKNLNSESDTQSVTPMTITITLSATELEEISKIKKTLLNLNGPGSNSGNTNSDLLFSESAVKALSVTDVKKKILHKFIENNNNVEVVEESLLNKVLTYGVKHDHLNLNHAESKSQFKMLLDVDDLRIPGQEWGSDPIQDQKQVKKIIVKTEQGGNDEKPTAEELDSIPSSETIRVLINMVLNGGKVERPGEPKNQTSSISAVGQSSGQTYRINEGNPNYKKNEKLVAKRRIRRPPQNGIRRRRNR